MGGLCGGRGGEGKAVAAEAGARNTADSAPSEHDPVDMADVVADEVADDDADEDAEDGAEDQHHAASGRASSAAGAAWTGIRARIDAGSGTPCSA